MADYTGQSLSPCPDSGGGLAIPTPQITIRKYPAGLNTYEIYLSWHSADQGFLSMNPEFFMFRYQGHGNWANDDGYKDKGYVHPSHQNGAKYPGGAWYNGADMDAASQTQGGRDTEWSANPLEAQKTMIMNSVQMRDWFTLHNGGGTYPIGDPALIPTREILPAARGSRATKGAYFKFAIGIDSGDDSGCPKTFGPKSDVMELRAVESSFNGNSQLIPVIGGGLGR